MVRKTVGLVLAAVIGSWAAAYTQEPELPPAPVPVAPDAPSPNPITIPPPRPLPPPPSPTPAFPAPVLLTNGPVVPPGAFHGLAPPPGWFGAIDLGVVVPHIKNRLQERVRIVNGFSTLVHLPTAELDWTVAPRFELGYRLPDELGEFLVSYRFLVSEGFASGRSEVIGLTTHGRLRSRLDLNVIDLDYAQREYGLGPNWDVKWRVGARIANVFFDSRSTLRFTVEDENFEMVERLRTSNYFFGAGPHVGLDLARRLGGSGLAVFTRLEGALVVGRINQSFSDSFAFDNGFALGGARSQHGTQAVPVLNVQAGFAWAPSVCPWTRLSAGYQYEHWWELGDVGNSKAELWDQGLFFRAEYKY
jgi:hypothetical protein